MHIITICPICNEDFMYHQTDVNLIRDITFVDEVGNNEIEKTVICQDCDSKEKDKQETIEEVAERLFPYKMEEYEIFLMGAKWQQERSYSEEDMIEAFKSGFTNGSNLNNLTFGEWFEQFKNK